MQGALFWEQWCYNEYSAVAGLSAPEDNGSQLRRLCNRLVGCKQIICHQNITSCLYIHVKLKDTYVSTGLVRIMKFSNMEFIWTMRAHTCHSMGHFMALGTRLWRLMVSKNGTIYCTHGAEQSSTCLNRSVSEDSQSTHKPSDYTSPHWFIFHFLSASTCLALVAEAKTKTGFTVFPVSLSHVAPTQAPYWYAGQHLNVVLPKIHSGSAWLTCWLLLNTVWMCIQVSAKLVVKLSAANM